MVPCSASVRLPNVNSDASIIFGVQKWALLPIFMKIRWKLWKFFYIFEIRDFWHPIARRSECSNANCEISMLSMQKWASLPIFFENRNKMRKKIIFSKRRHSGHTCAMSCFYKGHLPARASLLCLPPMIKGRLKTNSNWWILLNPVCDWLEFVYVVVNAFDWLARCSMKNRLYLSKISWLTYLLCLPSSPPVRSLGDLLGGQWMIRFLRHRNYMQNFNIVVQLSLP